MDTRRALNSSKRNRDAEHGTRASKSELELHDEGAKNASRDLTRRFSSMGLSMPVTISKIHHVLPEGETATTHWIKPTDWLRTLLRRGPHCLLGDCLNIDLQLESFWTLYQQHHPQHEVYQRRANDLRRTIPLSLFGDEGRGPKRGNFLIWSLESTIGLKDLPDNWKCTCGADLKKLPRTDLPELAWDGYGPQQVREEVYQRALKQMTNMKGHSYVTRHLIFGMPHWLYKNDKALILENHIDAITANMQDIFSRGVTVDGETYFGALVAIKGDMKHHLSLGLTRSYHKLYDGMMCSLCEAGKDGVPFESHQAEPVWASTLFRSRPWDDAPKVTEIPYDLSAPERSFALDPFHLFKVGMGRDLCGSMIVYLARAGFLDDVP